MKDEDSINRPDVARRVIREDRIKRENEGSTNAHIAPDPVRPVEWSGASRPATAIDLQHEETLNREVLQSYVEDFISRPTYEKYHRMKAAAIQYQTAWMQGRVRVLG